MVVLVLVVDSLHLVRLTVCLSVCRRHGFRRVTQVCFGISISNFICMFFVAMGLLIFSDVTFKMATWQPYWIFRFPDSNFSLAMDIKSILHWHITWRSLLIFSNVTCKMAAWRPYWLFRYLDSVGGMVSGAQLEFAWEFQFQISYPCCLWPVVCGDFQQCLTCKMAAWWPYWIFWFPGS